MFSFDQYHHLHHTDVAHKGLLGRHILIKSVGASFVSLFIPAVLYFEFGISLSGVFLYAMIHSIVALIVMLTWSASYIAKQGGRPAMIWGVVAFIVHMFILFLGDFQPWIVFAAPIFSGLHTAFFWVGMHYTMSHNARKEKDIGRTNAFMEQSTMIALIIGPYIGGLFADALGQSYLFGACAVFIGLSMFPLLASHRKHKERKYSVHKEFKFAREHRDMVKKYFKTFASVAYVQFIGSVLRSITLFAFFRDYSSVGLISALAGIVVIVIVRYVGKISDTDTKKGEQLVTVSTAFQGTNWFVAGLMIAGGFFSNTLFMIVDIFHKATYKVNNTYLTKVFYQSNDAIDKKHALYGIVIREGSIHGARIVLCLVGALVFNLFDSIEYIAILYVLVALFVPLQLSLISPRKSNTVK